jgi:hypothetical protein
VLRNLTNRSFHRIVALHRLDVHTSFPVDNSAAFWPLLLKTPLATRTAQSLKVLTSGPHHGLAESYPGSEMQEMSGEILQAWDKPVAWSSLPLFTPTWSKPVRLRFSCRPCYPEAYRAAVGALLVGMPPPGVIFAPGRRPTVLIWLHTADHIRLPSPVQEAEGAPAAGDWTRIMRFPVGEQEDTVALLFAYHRRGVFSSLLEAPHPCMPSLGWER